MIKSILGPNAYMAKAQLSQLLSSLDEGSVEYVEGAEVQIPELKQILSTQGLFFSPTVVVSNISEQKSLHDDFVAMLHSLDDGVELIIYEPTIDKRSKYYKYLLKSTDCSEFRQLDIGALSSWIVDEAKKRDGEIDRQSARYLAERIGEDQWRISNELEKLIMSDRQINRQLIDELVEPTPDENIFRLLDLVLAKNIEGTIKKFDNLIFQRMEPIYIMSMLTWQLHIVALIVYAKDRTPEQIAKDAKISPFVVKKTTPIAKKISKNHLRKMLELTALLDSDMKSKPIDTQEALKQLLIKLCEI